MVKVAEFIKLLNLGELEITNIDNYYLKEGRLLVQVFERGFAQIDTGIHESLLDAANFV